MNVTELELEGVLSIEPRIHTDMRGWFRETWNKRRYSDIGIDREFVQDNLSWSKRKTLRGLHYQDPHPQAKLVLVLLGEVFDVVVDLRRDSATYGDWIGVTLSAENGRQLFVPEGFAHGFVVTSKNALCMYKVTDSYHPECERALRWNDPAIGIEWPIPAPLLSEKDRRAPLLADIRE